MHIVSLGLHDYVIYGACVREVEREREERGREAASSLTSNNKNTHVKKGLCNAECTYTHSPTKA